MPYHVVNKIASWVWRQCGLEHVTATANGFIIFRFNTEENMHAVLEKRPWMFGGKNIIIQQWHSRFQFDKNKISTLLVWIRLHGLPFPLWSKQSLSLAASMVGRPLSCDEQTYNCTRLEYARVCVEIDAALPFIREFDIDNPFSVDPISVTMDYEWKPTRCDKCKVFSHSCTSTVTLKQQPTSSKGKEIVGAPNQPHNPVGLGNTTPIPPFATPIDPFSSITKAIPPATLDKGKGIVGVTVPPTSAVMDQAIPTSALPIPKPVLNTTTSTNPSLPMDPQSPYHHP